MTKTICKLDAASAAAVSAKAKCSRAFIEKPVVSRGPVTDAKLSNACFEYVLSGCDIARQQLHGSVFRGQHF